MSYFGNVMATCPNLQASINEMWMTPGMFPGADERMPFSEFINSPANRRAISYAITPGRGKVRTVELTYQQRHLEDVVRENQANPNCEATEKYGENISTYTLDTDVNLQVGQQIDITDYEGSCTDNTVLFSRQVALLIDVLDRRVATQQADQSAALTGGWGASLATGDNPGEVNAQNQFVVSTALATSGAPNWKTWNMLRNALDDSGFPGDVALFGGQTMREYWQYLQAGCCADYGLDLGELMGQYGYAYAYDKRVKDALGSANEFMIVAPGAIQPISFSRAEGKAAMGGIWDSSSNYFYATVRSPRLGLVYDLSAKDPCGTLSLNLTYTGKMIGLPNDLFAVGDEYEGVTYAAQGLVTNP